MTELWRKRRSSWLWKLQTFRTVFPKVSESIKHVLFSALWGAMIHEWARSQWWPRIFLKKVLENTKTPLADVSSKFRVLRSTWRLDTSEISQTQGTECVWNESTFSEHDGDLARGISVLKIINSSEKQSDLPLTVTNWINRFFCLWATEICQFGENEDAVSYHQRRNSVSLTFQSDSDEFRLWGNAH